MTQPASTALQLPPQRLFLQHCRHEDGWSDHYGALHDAAEYAGLVMPERYRIKALWQHGCFGPWEATSPGPLVYNSPAAGRLPLLVARREEAEFLHQHGYPQARAIGMPITYAPEPGLARIPRSLLVMPTHSLTGAKFEDRTPFARYAAEIKSVAGQFDRVVVCIHPSCRKNGLWIQEFTTQGIEIIDGAQTNDRHALRRMRALFAQFESVTSNGWGSHIAYSLAFGAKVSIWGSEIVNSEANSLLDRAWSANPETLAASKTEGVRRQKREFLHRLFREPADGLADQAWGRWFVGADHRLEPSAMAEVLSAIIDPAARPAALPASMAPAAATSDEIFGPEEVGNIQQLVAKYCGHPADPVLGQLLEFQQGLMNFLVTAEKGTLDRQFSGSFGVVFRAFVKCALSSETPTQEVCAQLAILDEALADAGNLKKDFDYRPLLARMLCAPAHWGAATLIPPEKIPAWLLEDYLGYVFQAPQVFVIGGEAELYHAHLLAWARAMHQRTRTAPSAAMTRRLATVFASKVNCNLLYLSQGNTREVMQLRAAILEFNLV